MNDIKEKFEEWVDDFISRNDGHQKRGIKEIMPDPMDIFEGGAESMHPEISKLTEQNKEMLEALKEFMKSNCNCGCFDECYKTDYMCTYKDKCRFIETADLIQKIEGE